MNLTKEEYLTLRTLGKDKTVVITKPDKENGVVIMDKTSYTDKVLSILSDSSKFQCLSFSGDELLPILTKQECKLARILRKLRSLNAIDKETYNKLLPSGSRPGIMFGLPKIHKADIPMRPILSAIGTFNYELARFLVSVLSPLIKKVSIRSVIPLSLLKKYPPVVVRTLLWLALM